MGYKKHKQYRLPHYDYAQPGEYFITICTKDRKYFFGNITKNTMYLSEIGKIAEKLLKEIPTTFPSIKLDEWIVMPDHIHMVLIIEKESKNAPRRVPTDSSSTKESNTINNTPTGLQPLVKGSISSAINHFKGNVKKWCNKNEHTNFAWQSRFHDHIIRDQRALENIRQYIRDNPLKWDKK